MSYINQLPRKDFVQLGIRYTNKLVGKFCPTLEDSIENQERSKNEISSHFSILLVCNGFCNFVSHYNKSFECWKQVWKLQNWNFDRKEYAWFQNSIGKSSFSHIYLNRKKRDKVHDSFFANKMIGNWYAMQTTKRNGLLNCSQSVYESIGK